ncbi:Cro/CI family transcriptional regulator [Pseudomonas sp. JUb52]|uniref:Cro/CI family transcriptional regulator n=1 Tax=Pseudomonas sp. JUb52 TaxID=2485127 RepID=UPI00104841EC|nr:Cro/CI family transcriptional regulator [Pseudomonas sp. JUb52]TCQ94093.1 YdaS antitoxin of YdaST toxin-antitoxin system [Pseudomonas sp. JUb52]
MELPFVRLVKFFGSQELTAKALGVKQGTVSGWVRGVHGCTALVALRAEVATGGAIKARDLCPGIPELQAMAS